MQSYINVALDTLSSTHAFGYDEANRRIAVERKWVPSFVEHNLELGFEPEVNFPSDRVTPVYRRSSGQLVDTETGEVLPA